MATISSIPKINIRPQVSILSVLQNMKYQPWFALAEFVDNSLQSYLDHKKEIHDAEGAKFKLKIDVQVGRSLY